MRNRQVPWIVQQRNEVPNVILQPLPGSILLHGVRRGKQIGEPGRPAASEPGAGEEVIEEVENKGKQVLEKEVERPLKQGYQNQQELWR